MKLYNSKTSKKEEFIPIEEGKLSMYVCGPTLYSEIHIGNARPLIFFDVVARYFKHLNYDVTYVSNITDIDDKIINRSQELGITEEELVAQNVVMYDEVKAKMNLLKPTYVPMVTKYIDQIINYIQKLIDLDFAYVSGGDVYFSVNKIEKYGEISNRKLDDLQAGARIETSDLKKYEHDFVLWKKTTTGVTWNAPFGEGRPGWHTECVVMINDILGDTIDIHGGGMDLKFPHHENENAQSHACGHDLANVWMHNGFVNIDDTKMSKSLGNVISPTSILEEYGTNFLRLLMLRSSYRGPINLNDDVKQQLTKETKKLIRFAKAYPIRDSYKESKYTQMIDEEMSNDFNTANAYSKFIAMMNDEKIKDEEKANVQSYFYYIFGLVAPIEEENEVPLEIIKLIEQRTQAKKDRNFALADELREQIDSLGYEIKDTREGVTCHKK